MIYGGYRAYTHLCELCIELIRQFYDAPRCFRIVGEGGVRFLRFSNAGLLARPLGDVFDRGGYGRGEADLVTSRCAVRRPAPYSRIAQNELAKELFGMGLFRPEMADQARSCLEMMDFEGKDMVLAKISQAGRLAAAGGGTEGAIAAAGSGSGSTGAARASTRRRGGGQQGFTRTETDGARDGTRRRRKRGGHGGRVRPHRK